MEYHQKKCGCIKAKGKAKEIFVSNYLQRLWNIGGRHFKSLQTLDHVELVIKQVQQQLKHLHLGFRLSIFLVPIVHLYKHEEHDISVILIKVCPIYFEWFTTNIIVVASYGHTYHPFCLFTHLQTSVTCVVEFCLDLVLHLDWWQSMGISPLWEGHKQIVMDLHRVQQQQWFQEKINHMQQEGKHYIFIYIFLFFINYKFQNSSL
jgi:hypothetical protein